MLPALPSRGSLEWHPTFERPVSMRVRPPRVPHRHSREWGLGQSTTQLTQEGITLATTGTVIGATVAGAAAIGAIAGPIGAIAGVLAGILSQEFSGCGQSCTLTSEAANQIEQAFQQNVQAYLSSSRTKSEQAAALANFDNTWAKLVQYCGNPSFGSAGQRCVTDREQGACKYKTSPGGWNASSCTYTYPGTNGSGSTCWNWFVGYRDPIALDPCVVPDATVPTTSSGATPAQVSQGVSQIWGQVSSNPWPLFLIAGLVALAVIL